MEGTDASVKGGNGFPPVASRITINGHGATIVRQGSVLFRFFLITEGSLTLNDLSLTGGNVGVEQEYDGGAIAIDMWNPLQPPRLTLNRVNVSGNTANNGGGIMAVMGELTVNASTFTDNVAEMTGGAVQVIMGSANVLDSVFEGNEARKVEGGAIGVFLGSLDMTGTLLASNSARGGGGGVYSQAATVTVQGSCFVGNKTTAPQYLGFGSGIHGPATAADNWWGDEAGPQTEGGAGKGDAVTNGVVFEPFLREAPAFCLSAGAP
jgi:predicted outer membrane repeat protein